MNLVLIIHEIALILTLIIGLIYIFKRNDGLKRTHFTLGLITLFTIIIFLVQDSFSNMGYNVYGLLLLAVFASMLFKKRSLVLHIALFIIAISWLIAIHVI